MNQNHLNEYIKRAYETACKHGFHDEERTVQHWLMLVITEVAEMVEADRKGKHAQVAMFKRESVTPQPKENKMKHWRFCFESFIKDTVEDEMADVCIRLFDLAGLKGWRLSAVHSERLGEQYLSLLRRHTSTESAWDLCKQLAPLYGFQEMDAELALFYIECWAKSMDIDIEWHINQKLEYNEQRDRMHGKKY